jgi:hypothetical protein
MRIPGRQALAGRDDDAFQEYAAESGTVTLKFPVWSV